MSSGDDAGGSWGENDVCVRVLSARSGMRNSCFAWSRIHGHGAQGRIWISPGAASTCGAARRHGHRRATRARTSSKRMRGNS
jgi:hypothetical protein